MSTGSRLPLPLAAAFSATDLGLFTFLLLGLLSERLPMQYQTHWPLVTILLGASAVVCVASFVLIYRWTVPHRETQSRGLRWLLGGLLSAGVAFGIGFVLFAVAHEVLPRRWFSRGGDWDFDPLIEMVGFGLLCALAGFWLVYRRGWRVKTSVEI